MKLAVLIALLLASGAANAQLKDRSESEPVDQTAGMIDEDEDLLPQVEYAFNPIQAKNDLKVGKFYAKRGNYRAAAARYLEATRWNPQYAEAYWRLGDARYELSQTPQALDAYRSYLTLEPNGKQADQARERIKALEKTLASPPLAAEDAPEQAPAAGSEP